MTCKTFKTNVRKVLSQRLLKTQELATLRSSFPCNVVGHGCWTKLELALFMPKLLLICVTAVTQNMNMHVYIKYDVTVLSLSDEDDWRVSSAHWQKHFRYEGTFSESKELVRYSNHTRKRFLCPTSAIIFLKGKYGKVRKRGIMLKLGNLFVACKRIIWKKRNYDPEFLAEDICFNLKIHTVQNICFHVLLIFRQFTWLHDPSPLSKWRITGSLM